MDSIKIVVIALFLSFVNIFIIHIVKTKFPKSYFSLGQLVITERDDISIGGLITKFLPPVIISIIIGLFTGNEGLPIVILYGFFASFLVIWPVVLSGNEILSWDAKKKIKTLYLIYSFFIISYVILALLGYNAGKAFQSVDLKSWISNIITEYPNWPKIEQDLFTGCISAAVIGIIGTGIAFIFRKAVNRLKKLIYEENLKQMEKKCD